MGSYNCIMIRLKWMRSLFLHYHLLICIDSISFSNTLTTSKICKATVHRICWFPAFCNSLNSLYICMYNWADIASKMLCHVICLFSSLMVIIKYLNNVVLGKNWNFSEISFSKVGYSPEHSKSATLPCYLIADNFFVFVRCLNIFLRRKSSLFIFIVVTCFTPLLLQVMLCFS